MVDVSSQSNKVNITVSSSGNTANTNVTPDYAQYYSEKSKEWAISDRIVDNTDYSSKYYANESKKQADISTVKTTEVVESGNTALSNIATAEINVLAKIDTSRLNTLIQIEELTNSSIEDINATGIDTKVSKSGDTMTGNLHISSSQPTYYLKNENFDFTSTTAPSTDQILSSILHIDKNGNYYNYCQTRFASNNTLNASLGVRRLIDGIEHTNNIGVGITAEGTKFTYAPTPPLSDNSTKIATTAFCDGNWVNKYFRIANEVEIAPGATKTYSLSSYLPNDGNKYEVLITGYGKTNPSTGSSMYLSLDSDFITSDVMVVHSYASANYKVHSAFSFTTISSTGRSITVMNGSNAVNNGVFDIRAIGYRRVR